MLVRRCLLYFVLSAFARNVHDSLCNQPAVVLIKVSLTLIIVLVGIRAKALEFCVINGCEAIFTFLLI